MTRIEESAKYFVTKRWSQLYANRKTVDSGWLALNLENQPQMTDEVKEELGKLQKSLAHEASACLELIAQIYKVIGK